MTPQEINVEIAKVCGWKRTAVGSWEKPETCAVYFKSSSTWCVEYAPPDYYHDLNAMHEAETVLARECKESGYWFFLRQLLGFPEAESDWSATEYFAAIHASPAQRAEAFLKTLNLWHQ